MNRANQAGMTLLELMIAMTIGLFVVGGAFAIFMDANQNQRTNENVARMQENARYALDVIRPDARMAGYWGFIRDINAVQGGKGSAIELDTISGDCAARWYIDVANAVDATNGTNPFSATCLPASEYLAGTDILVIRHTAVTPTTTLADNTVYVRADRFRAEVFLGSLGVSGEFAPDFGDHRLLTHAYYVRPYTFAVGDGLPSLRRIALADGPALVHEEIISGIEDLQVQFGVDDNGDGAVNRYVDPDTAIAASARIRALRVWIMARSAQAETGFTDTNTYDYANVSVTPNNGFRRMLLSGTIQLRNLAED